MVRKPSRISFAAPALTTAVISGVIRFLSFRKIRNLKQSDMQSKEDSREDSELYRPDRAGLSVILRPVPCRTVSVRRH